MKRIRCIQTNKTFKSAIDLSLSLGRGRCFASQISANLAKNNLFKYFTPLIRPCQHFS